MPVIGSGEGTVGGLDLQLLLIGDGIGNEKRIDKPRQVQIGFGAREFIFHRAFYGGNGFVRNLRGYARREGNGRSCCCKSDPKNKKLNSFRWSLSYLDWRSRHLAQEESAAAPAIFLSFALRFRARANLGSMPKREPIQQYVMAMEYC